MLKQTIILVCAFMIIACAPRTKDASDREEPPQTVSETDLSVCRTGPTARSIDGRWEARARIGQLRLRLLLDFHQAYLSMEKTCTLINGPSAVARVNSLIDKTVSSFVILQDAQDEHHNADQGQQVSCSLALARGQSFHYRFNGRCVDITENGVTRTFVPIL